MEDERDNEAKTSCPRSITTFRSSHPTQQGGKKTLEKEELEFEKEAFVKVARQLYLVSFLVAAVVFICQIVVAGCLCRPPVIVSGLWVAALFLGHGYLGMKVLNFYTHSMLIGHACLSILTSIIGLGSAIYVLSGQMRWLCVSPFHGDNESSLVRLYVAEVTCLATSVPCLIGSVTCTISAVLSILSAKKINQHKIEECPAPYIFFLQDGYTSTRTGQKASAPGGIGDKNQGTPPPSYVHFDESCA